VLRSAPRLGSPCRRRAALAALAAGLALATPAPAAADVRPGEYARRHEPIVFPAQFAPLTRLGEWVRLEGGAVAWRPDPVADDWQPYRDGHWAHTAQGWFWVSAEPWAWATYHFGRWRFDPALRWVWVPGGEWKTSRVTWRYGAGIVGWAPDPGDGRVLPGHWTFVPADRFAGVPVAESADARLGALLATTRVRGAGEGPRPAFHRGPATVEVPAAPSPPAERGGGELHGRVAAIAP
jgi:hypothetical protein